MKKTSYIGQSAVELKKALTDKREAFRNFRFGTAGSKTRNVKDGRLIKKEIARIMTEMTKLKNK